MSLPMEPEHQEGQSSLSPPVVMENPKFTPGSAQHPARRHLHGHVQGWDRCCAQHHRHGSGKAVPVR